MCSSVNVFTKLVFLKLKEREVSSPHFFIGSVFRCLQPRLRVLDPIFLARVQTYRTKMNLDPSLI